MNFISSSFFIPQTINDIIAEKHILCYNVIVDNNCISAMNVKLKNLGTNKKGDNEREKIIFY